MIVKELITRLAYKVDPRGYRQYEQQMRGLQRQVQQTTRNMHGTFSRVTSSISKMLNLSLKIHGVTAAKNELSGLNSSVGRLSGRLKGLAVSALGLYGVKEFSEKLFNDIGSKQQQLARLTTQEGSREAGAKKRKELAKFGEITPFETPDLINLYSAIKGSGYQLSNADLTGLGDVTSGSAKKLPEMMEMLKSVNRGMTSMFDNFDGLRASTNDGITTLNRYDNKLKKWISKDIQEGDMAGLVSFVRTHGERNYSGEMDRQSKTLPGMQSTLNDKIRTRFEEIGDAGAEKVLTDLMERALKKVDAMAPYTEKVGKFIGDLPKYLKAAKPYIEPVGTALGMMAAGFVAMKGIAIGSGVLTFFGSIASLGAGAIGIISSLVTGLPVIIGGIQGFASMAMMAGPMATLGTIFGAIGAALLPLLTGGLIVGVIAGITFLGAKLADYWIRGDQALTGLRTQFPALADGIKIIGDEMMAWWPIIRDFLIGGFNLLWPVIQWVFTGVLIPLIGTALQWLGNISNWIRTAVEYWMPLLTNSFVFWKETLAPIFQWLGDRFNDFFGWLNQGKGLVDGLVGGVAGMLGMQTDGGGGTAATGLDGYNASFGGKFAQMAKTTAAAMNTTNKCAYGFETSFEKMTGIALRGHAFELKAQMDKQKMFKRVQVTDEQMKSLPPGTVVVHDRNLAYKGRGMGGQYGHVSVALGNGMEASDHIQKQMVNHYAGGARYVYIPVGAQMPGPKTPAAQKPTQKIEIKVDARNSTNPTQTKAKVKEGVAEAMNNVDKNNQKATPAKR